MPKYHYMCKTCDTGYYIYHGMNEEHNECLQCGLETIHRVPEMPFIRREIKTESGKVGDEVKNAIEENRAILDEAKKKARNNNWEPNT
ncbi:hypothetical protein N9S04_00055 [bacterium]|jgi:hypothetical protein|nr:hypothetical protein [bacterium]